MYTREATIDLRIVRAAVRVTFKVQQVLQLHCPKASPKEADQGTRR
jgi:hypothetical protein